MKAENLSKLSGRSTVKMTKDEYERLILEKHKDKLYFDEKICKGAKITDISKEKLSELKAIRFKGVDETKPMLDFKTIGGDAITLLEKAESFIYDHIPMKAWIESGKLQRQEKWLYPPDAIREALANALAHRDYASPGKVQVRIFDDRLEVWNPGLLPPPLTLEKLKGKHDSFPRNPLIAKAFFWIKFAEDVGSGTSKIIQWCKEWGLPEPAYEEAGASFVTVFYNPKPEESIQRGSDKRLVEGLVESQRKMLDLIKKNPHVSKKELSSRVGISTTAIDKNINQLKKKGLINRVGPDKGGHWEVK